MLVCKIEFQRVPRSEQQERRDSMHSNVIINGKIHRVVERKS